MSTSSNTQGQPHTALQTFLSPFYILATVISGLITIVLVILAIRGCVRRRRTRRRFVQLVDEGWLVPVFRVPEWFLGRDEEDARVAAPSDKTKPDMCHCVVSSEGGEAKDCVNWQNVKPLSGSILPGETPSADILLHLFRTSSSFTTRIRERANLLKSVRSPKSTPASASTSSTPPSTLQVSFIITMPTPHTFPLARPTSSYITVGGATPEVCLGVYQAPTSLTVPKNSVPAPPDFAADDEDEDEEEEGPGGPGEADAASQLPPQIMEYYAESVYAPSQQESYLGTMSGAAHSSYSLSSNQAPPTLPQQYYGSHLSLPQFRTSQANALQRTSIDEHDERLR